MQRVLGSGRRSTEEYFLGAVCLYQGLGRLGEATLLFKRANDFDFAKAEFSASRKAPIACSMKYGCAISAMPRRLTM